MKPQILKNQPSTFLKLLHGVLQFHLNQNALSQPMKTYTNNLLQINYPETLGTDTQLHMHEGDSHQLVKSKTANSKNKQPKLHFDFTFSELQTPETHLPALAP